jgi:hypothetical protein
MVLPAVTTAGVGVTTIDSRGFDPLLSLSSLLLLQAAAHSAAAQTVMITIFFIVLNFQS